MSEVSQQRVGLYAWEGPNTIELLNTKYHTPRIAHDTFFRLYTPDYLRVAQEKIGLTDLWMTCSWGFSDEREQEQYDYVATYLPSIKERGIHTYGYVQGLNVVGGDFPRADFFCKSAQGARIPYSKDRYLICPSHPDTYTHLERRVARVAQMGFDAVFVDNILFGLLPLVVGKNISTSFGCHCRHCADAFEARYAYALPVRPESEEQLYDFLRFRVEQTTALVARLSDVARTHGAQFGVNLFDPLWHTPELYFGFSLEQLKPYLDYYLIENHALTRTSHVPKNTHLATLREDGKPLFVLSYRNGIGCESAYSQETIERMFAEADAHGFSVCLKGSEFTTRGVWHTLDIEALSRVTRTSAQETTHQYEADVPNSLELPVLPRRTAFTRLCIQMCDRFVPQIYDFLYHSRVAWSLFVWSGLYTRALRQRRAFMLDTVRLYDE